MLDEIGVEVVTSSSAGQVGHATRSGRNKLGDSPLAQPVDAEGRGIDHAVVAVTRALEKSLHQCEPWISRFGRHAELLLNAEEERNRGSLRTFAQADPQRRGVRSIGKMGGDVPT